MTLREGTELLGAAIQYSCENGISRLLIDVTQTSGYDPLSTWDRFELGDELARHAVCAIAVAFVARPESVDPQRFAMVVARNRGLYADVFTSEPVALEWLLAGTGGQADSGTQ